MRLLHLHFLVRCSYYSLTRPSSNGTPEHPLLLHIIDVDGEHATFSSTTTNRCWLPQVNFLSRSVISGFTSAVSVVFICPGARQCTLQLARHNTNENPDCGLWTDLTSIIATVQCHCVMCQPVSPCQFVCERSSRTSSASRRTLQTRSTCSSNRCSTTLTAGIGRSLSW